MSGRPPEAPSNATPLPFRPGTLWPATVERTRRALASGALRPITTEQQFLDDSGVRFAVRVLPSLARKDTDRELQPGRDRGPRDPFLPYEEELLVASLTSTHLALLNKFKVIDHHLLIVTRHFEHQERLLSLADFLAVAACLGEFAGLAFYNGGAAAGASQMHKHLQYVPLPLVEGIPGAPVEPLFESVRRRPGVGTVPGFAFRHGFAWLGAANPAIVPEVAEELLANYRTLLAAVGIHPLPGAVELRQSAPYNLLFTRRWMLLVPRSRECFETLSINALAYAGSLFVRNGAQLEILRRVGPMTVLGDVAAD